MMFDVVRPIGITVNPSVSMVALVTLATAIVFGLALLPRPSRATIAWSAAFGLSMIGTYVWVAAMQFDQPGLRALSSGLIVCFEPLIWLGVRYYARKRAPWPVTALFIAVVPLVLFLTAGDPAYPTVFRIVFSVSAVFAGLVAYELFTLRLSARDVVLPLALVSSAFVVVAVLGVAAGMAGIGSSSGDELGMLRDINGVGILLTSQCAAITIVLLARGEALLRGRLRSAVGEGDEPLRRRLERARAQRDAGWSLLDIRLDDPADLQEAMGGLAFARVVDVFHAHVADALPAVADVARISDVRTLVLLPGSDEAVRHHLRILLARVSEIEETGSDSSTRVSASVGWARAVVADFDFDALVGEAACAAGAARDKGGDRWERATEGTAATLEG